MIRYIDEDRAARELEKWRPEEGMQATSVFVGSISFQANKGQLSYTKAKAGLTGAAATFLKSHISRRALLRCLSQMYRHANGASTKQ